AKTLLDIETLDEKQIKGLFHEGILPEPEIVEEEDVKVNISSKEDDSPETYEEAKAKADEKYDEKAHETTDEEKSETQFEGEKTDAPNEDVSNKDEKTDDSNTNETNEKNE